VHVPLVCQAPEALHVCTSRPQLPQATGLVCPGAHTPVQALETQVLFEHGAEGPQVPVASHVWTPLATHCCEPGTQAPVHWPAPVQT
jgi:hypothetical protein